MKELKTWCDAEKGRYTALARHLQRVPSFVTKMANGEKPVPLDLCGPIESFTGIACELLRPDQAEHFAYMRHRPEPELTVEPMPVTDPVEKAVVMGCDVTPKGVVCSGHLIEEINTKEI